MVIVNLGSEARVCGAGLSVVQQPGAGSPVSDPHLCSGEVMGICTMDGVKTESARGKHLKHAWHMVSAQCTFLFSPPCFR